MSRRDRYDRSDLGPNVAAFRAVVDTAVGLSDADAAALSGEAVAGSTERTTRAGQRAYDAARESGRWITWPVQQDVEMVCDPLGAGDTALAVLVCDLISPADYAELVRPWVARGLPLAGAPAPDQLLLPDPPARFWVWLNTRLTARQLRRDRRWDETR